MVRPACCRGLRPSSWCSTFPGSMLPRGVAHRRYACVVCAHTSASGCSPTRGIPGGMSTGSSAVLPGTAFIELVLDVPRERAPPGCSAPALRLRCLRIRRRAGARQPGVFPGGTSTSSSGGAGPRVNPQPWPASGGRLHLDHPRLWCVVLDRFNALVPGGSGLILLAGAYHLMVGRLEIEHELA